MVLYHVLWTKICNYKNSESLCTLLRLLQLQESEESTLPNALRVTGEKGLAKSHIIHVGPDSAWLLWEVLCVYKQERKRFSRSLLLFCFIDSTLWKAMGSHHAALGGGTWCTLKEFKTTSLPSPGHSAAVLGDISCP